MQDFYRFADGYAEQVAVVSDTRCVKLVADMHYEAQVQCVINYAYAFLKQKLKKDVARNLKLTGSNTCR